MIRYRDLIVPGVSLDEARRAYMRALGGEGSACPCCDRWGKIQRRRLRGVFAATLIWMHNQRKRWIRIVDEAPRFVLKTKEHSLLRYWRLLEPGEYAHWGLTTWGRLFVLGRVKVRSHIFTYYGRFYGFSGRRVSIDECLGVNFDYDELMSGRYPGGRS